MSTIDASALTDELWVGAYPQSPDDVLFLQGRGLTAILNLQSDDDFADRGINWNLFWRFYVARGLEVVRVPILDFEPDALLARLDDGVAALEDLVSRGRKVYVHCTAGVNRSPTVCIAWLAAHRGMALDDAVEHVRTIRPRVYPYPEVLAAWGKNRT